MCEGSKPVDQNRKKADSPEKGRGGEKEGPKTSSAKGRQTKFISLAAVQRKLVDEKCRKKLPGNYNVAKKPNATDKTENERHHKKTTVNVADQNGQSSVKKIPKNEVMTKKQIHNMDKSVAGAQKEISERKMKTAEQMEVKALDTWTAVHEKKVKRKEKEKMPDAESFGHIKEVREQNMKKSKDFKSVEYDGKENSPKKKVQLLEEIRKMDTHSQSLDCNKNLKPGRKEKRDPRAMSEQSFEKENVSNEKMQKIRRRNEHVTVTILETQKDLKQKNSPSLINTKNVRPTLSPNILARDQQSCGQPLHKALTVSARPVDSPYVSGIRQCGMKVLNTHQPNSKKNPASVVTTTQSKRHCNLPDIYDTKKQSGSEVYISSPSNRIPANSATMFNVYNKPGSPPATRIHVPPFVPLQTTTEQIPTKDITRTPAQKSSPVIKCPQSSEEIRNCVHTPKVPVDRTKGVLVISQNKKEKTVSFRCCIQKKVDNGRPISENRNGNRKVTSKNISAYKIVMSNEYQASRK